MIDIKDISGNTILSVPITQECERIEELMQSDHAVVSWSSEKDDILPLGAYIEYKGERLSLLEPYAPEQKDELERLYKPLFQSKIMVWRKTPFFMYTRVNGTITSREADWTLTDNPANFMATVCDAIKNETGEIWTYAVDASLLASTSLSFQSVDIFSALNQVANAFETEWWADKANKVIHLSKASHGTAVTLEVGANIKTPSITSGKQGYFTRFYAFGSTRNITQDYKGANVNNLINKRLTLDPVKFPDGYKDIRPDLKQGEVFSKVLVFDDIYPSSKMAIGDARSRLMWVLNESSEKTQVGTDSEGNPIYDQCAVWYFQIPGFVFNNTKYDKDKNPDGMLIEGKNHSVRFESGPLSGREFEFVYHDAAKIVSTSDGLSFQVKKGDFEIKYIKEENYIIPDMTALVPVDGNDIVLFNVKMPSEYTASAYTDLESALDKEIERLTSDLNNYQFESNPVSFQDNNPVLSIGRNVTYKNGSYSYSTRVIKLTTKMDYDCEQNITIGNEQTKGTVQELKEEVISANKDLNLLQAFNDMTSSLQKSYTRTQQMMLDGFASIKNIWQLKEDENGNKYAQSAYHIVTERGATFNASEKPLVPSIFEGLPLDQQTLKWVDGVLKVVGDIGGGIKSVPVVGTGNAITDASLSDDGKTLTLTKGTTFLTDHQSLSGYATETWVTGKGYLAATGEDKTNWNTAFVWGDHSKGGYAKTSALNDYVTLGTKQDISGSKAFTADTTAFKGITIGGVSIKKSEEGVLLLEGDLLITGTATFLAQGSRSASTIMDGVIVDGTTIIKEDGKLKVVGSGGSGISGIKLNGSTYSPDAEKFITLPDYPTLAWGGITGKPSTLAGYGITDGVKGITVHGTNYYPDGNKNVVLPVFTANGSLLDAPKLAVVNVDSVMEVGRHIDFHLEDSTKDYDVRLTAHSNYLAVSGGLDVSTEIDVHSSATIRGNLLNVGGAWSAVDGSRAQINLISAGNVPNDLYFGSNGNKYYSLTSRENDSFWLYSVTAERAVWQYDNGNRKTYINSHGGSNALEIYSSGTSGVYMNASYNGNNAEFGMYNGFGAYMQSQSLSGAPTLCLPRGDINGAEFRLNGVNHTMWHRGNFSLTNSAMTQDIVVNGDANTYYPVTIDFDEIWRKESPNIITVWRNLGEQCASYPGNHENGTSSLFLRYDYRSLTWDGNGGFCTTERNSQLYAQLVSNTYQGGNGTNVLIVYLRGGGTVYHISASSNNMYCNVIAVPLKFKIVL